MDATKGLHADVVVSGDKAYIFYFTHPNRKKSYVDMDKTEDVPDRKSVV